MRRAHDVAGFTQVAQDGGEGLVADLELGAQLFLRERCVVVAQGAEDLLSEGVVPRSRPRGRGRWRRVIVELEVDRVGVVEAEDEGIGCAGGAVLDGESELLVVALQVEERIPPAMLSPALC
jgi:hypothetical protein